MVRSKARHVETHNGDTQQAQSPRACAEHFWVLNVKPQKSESCERTETQICSPAQRNGRPLLPPSSLLPPRPSLLLPSHFSALPLCMSLPALSHAQLPSSGHQAVRQTFATLFPPVLPILYSTTVCSQSLPVLVSACSC